jgi:hypothetical protein
MQEDRQRVTTADTTTPRRWLLLIYRVPQDPPGRRTYVWRQLKQLGAVYLQQAVVIVPERPDLRAGLEHLARRISDFGGEVSLLETTTPTPAWEEGLIGRFNTARAAEYAELVENVERFEDEIRRERRKERFQFAQLEDIEAEWEKLRRWHERVLSRDFFEAPTRTETAAALQRGREALDTYAAEVYAREGVEADVDSASGC